MIQTSKAVALRQPAAAAAAPASPATSPATPPGSDTPWQRPGAPVLVVPESAKLPRPGDDPNLVGGEPPLEEISEKVGGSLPDWIRDPMYNDLIKQVNKFIFRSRPGSPPIPQEGGWHFSALGDYGNGTKAQADVAANLLKWKPELVLTAGDNVYPTSEPQNWAAHFDKPEEMGNIMRAAPVLPCVGNHDIKPTPAEYFKRFPQLHDARYYSADFKNLHVVSLDSNDTLAPGSPQAAWLEQDLAGTKQPWKVVEFHHPMMSVISKVHYRNTSRLPEYLGPMFAKYGVDLVLVGHEHWYERTKPLNDKGTTQVTVGGGGGALYPFPYPQTSWSQTRDLDFGHVDFEVVGNDRMIGRYMKRDGTIGDSFVLDHGASARAAGGVGDAAAAATAVQAPAAPEPATAGRG